MCNCEGGVYMTKPKKEVLNYLENNNFITTKQAKYLGVKRHTLSNMVKSGEIIRSKRGVYSTKDTLLDDFYLIQVNNKNVIFSHSTALYLNGYSDKIPHVIHLTVPQGYNVGHLDKEEERMIFHYVKEEVFNIGEVEIETFFGNKVRVYDLERCICDIISDRKKTDKQIFTQALKEYFSSAEKDLRKLIKYSRLFKVENEVRKYIEVLV